MKIISLDPASTEILCSLKQEENIVAVSHASDFPPAIDHIPRITTPSGQGIPCHEKGFILDQGAFDAYEPDLVFTSFEKEDELQQFSNWVGERYPTVEVVSHFPRRLEEVYAMFESIGTACSLRQEGRALAQKLKAQLSSWVDNFYERLQSSKILLLSSIDPMVIPGWYVADMVRLTSANLVGVDPGTPEREIGWKEVQDLNPAVIIVAPEGGEPNQNLAFFRYFEAQEGWEDIMAVKRGQVYFSTGIFYFSRPSMRLMSAMAYLISALAGFDSGYITERDSFQRLRWLEVQRHRFR